MDKQQQSSVRLNENVLIVMALRPESERVKCPVCNGEKRVNQPLCSKCYKETPQVIGRIKYAIDDIRKFPPREIKIAMVEFSIKVISSGGAPAVMTETILRAYPADYPEFAEVYPSARLSAVEDAVGAIKVAPLLQTYAANKNMTFEAVDHLCDAYRRDNPESPSNFVLKAAIYKIIWPKTQELREKERQSQAFEAEVSKVIAELRAMSWRDAQNTTPVIIRDSLIDDRKVSEATSRFYFAVAREALNRFGAENAKKNSDLLARNIEIAKKQAKVDMTARVEGRKYPVKKEQNQKVA